MRIGLCTGGGDCPGLNAAIRAIVKSLATRKDVELFGIFDSFKGLQSKQPRYKKLSLNDVTDIYFKGGTILGTHNKSPRTAKAFQSSIEASCLGYKELGLDALIAIGGEGTQNIAKELSLLGLNIIGIPKTIDNDLPETEHTIGFATCVDLVSESVVRLQSTAESHDRIMILEVMGRDSGYIALHGGLAGGAHVILIPEIPFSYDLIAEKILERKSLGRNYSVIVVSEGVRNRHHKQSANTPISQILAKELSKRLNMESRVTVLGHLQRGGTPNAQDRLLGTKLGVYACWLLEKKKFGRLITVKGSEFSSIDYKKLNSRERKKVSLKDFTLLSAESIGISFGRKRES